MILSEDIGATMLIPMSTANGKYWLDFTTLCTLDEHLQGTSYVSKIGQTEKENVATRQRDKYHPGTWRQPDLKVQGLPRPGGPLEIHTHHLRKVARGGQRRMQTERPDNLTCGQTWS